MLATNKVLQHERYRIIHHLEENISGGVYEAFDNILGTNVVLKEIRVDLDKVVTASKQESRRLAFANEAKALIEIKHDSLSRVHDYFSEIDCQYLVLEAVDGRDLSELLEKDKKPVSLADFNNWADQLLDALNFLHTQTPPIIHGEISPKNIKLTSEGKVKLLNVGFTKNAATKDGNNKTSQSALQYLPLEQIWADLDTASRKVILNSYDERSEKILEQPADARSDLYALAATLYHLITARPPIDALERSIDILEGKTDPLPAPSQLNPQIPQEISDILLRAMEIRRENRYSSASILRQLLRAAFTKIKERDAAKQEQIKAAEQLAFEQQRQLAEKERIEREQKLAEQRKLEAEAEQKRQMELIELQLRQSEEQRLKAEQRAAEAEKLLREKEAATAAAALAAKQNDERISEPIENVAVIEEIIDNEVLEVTEFEVEEILPQAAVVEMAPDAINEVSEPVENAKPTVQTAQPVESDFGEMFAVPEKNNNVFKQMMIAVVALLILGGAGFGIWSAMQTKPGGEQQQQQPPAAQNISSQPPVPSTEAAKSETTTEQPANAANSNVAETPAALSETETEIPVDSTEFRNKSVSPASKAKRQSLPATKAPPAGQKKSVTVEDIINDN